MSAESMIGFEIGPTVLVNRAPGVCVLSKRCTLKRRERRFIARREPKAAIRAQSSSVDRLMTPVPGINRTGL